MPSPIAAEGFTELERAFKQLGKEAHDGFVGELRTAVEPARTAAEQLAKGGIKRIGPEWWRIKVGSTSKEVYITPATRRSTGTPRPNLAVLLITKAMVPGVEATQPAIAAGLEKGIDRAIARAGF